MKAPIKPGPGVKERLEGQALLDAIAMERFIDAVCKAKTRLIWERLGKALRPRDS